MRCRSSNSNQDVSELGDKFKLTAIHININSVRSHINLLKNYLLQNPIVHVITVSESKLPSSLEIDSKIELNNYNIKTTHGGFKEIVLANGDTFNIPNMPKEGELNIENIFKAPYMIT